MAVPQIPITVCERLLEAATRPCPVVAAAAPSATDMPQPEWDALANSFASIGNAFAMGSLLIGVVTLLAGIGWGLWVKKWAEDAAKDEARTHAKALVAEWCRTEAPQIARRHVDFLMNTSLGNTDDVEAADEIGEEAG